MKNMPVQSETRLWFSIILTRAGNPPGFPLSTYIAVELSCGSYGHLAIPNPIPGTYSDLGKCVKFACMSALKRRTHTHISCQYIFTFLFYYEFLYTVRTPRSVTVRRVYSYVGYMFMHFTSRFYVQFLYFFFNFMPGKIAGKTYYHFIAIPDVSDKYSRNEIYRFSVSYARVIGKS